MNERVINFNDSRAERYLTDTLRGFLSDPADNEFQRGYLACALAVYREGINGQALGDWLAKLEGQMEANE